MRGNWSLTKVYFLTFYISRQGKYLSLQDQLDADILPDFCSGFLYVTRPEVGAGLAQVFVKSMSSPEELLEEWILDLK